ncbi:MAG TPA: hypothetical protein VKZ53_27175 [Candidatus Angelobacter sp.]|nr:hypothetical protein [Candidatus Angelobacter sp.]
MPAETDKKQLGSWGAMVAGASVLVKRQRILWWLFAINLALGLIAALPVRNALGGILDHSLASRPLADRFDLTAYVELMSTPQYSGSTYATFSILIAIVFAGVLLFAEPGVIQEFRFATDAGAQEGKQSSLKQSSAEFFSACGGFFGRMVRLLLCALVPLGLLGVLRGGVAALNTAISDRSSSETTAIKLSVISGVVFFLLFLIVRVWISMAQIHTVASGERAMRRAFFSAGSRLAFRNLGTLYTVQFLTSVVTFLAVAMGIAVWTNLVPPASVGLAFVVSEATLLAMLAGRLWQKASLVAWHEHYLATLPVPAPPHVQEPLQSTPDTTDTSEVTPEPGVETPEDIVDPKPDAAMFNTPDNG